MPRLIWGFIGAAMLIGTFVGIHAVVETLTGGTS